MSGFSLLQHNAENQVVQFKLRKKSCVYLFMQAGFPKAQQVCPLASLFIVQIQISKIKTKVFILSFPALSHLAK